MSAVLAAPETVPTTWPFLFRASAVTVALEEADSRAVEAGDEVGVRRLAASVQHAHRRYRTFPLPWPPRFMPF